MKKLVTALFLCCALAFAETQPAVAMRNARIVTVSGPVIAKGTVVIRNGLIDAVGENVAVPADAWLIDGEGMTVYPGLIDALSTWGHPAARQRPPPPPRARRTRRAPQLRRHPRARHATAAAPARGPEDRPPPPVGSRSPIEIRPTDRRIEPGAQRRIHHRRDLPDARHLRRPGRGDRPARGDKSGEW